MLDALLAFTIFAASAPKVLYKPDPARLTDVGTVDLETPRRHPCFGVLRASVLLSSRKTDRMRAYVVSVTTADSPAPEVIQAGSLGGTPMRMVSVRNGDVACTAYQCPTGSSAVFEISEAQRQQVLSSGAAALQVMTSAGDRCPVDLSVTKPLIDTLDAWAGTLPKPAG